ncbi:hypothetical protein F511_06968 [Dorcoceras hygrometricum]|uniref:Uncharacterized protein n=1 Tax=Dorcoceras hygrometricum TaxID=472368 RepID=A0A2Z7B953_9LAMI|nr:hypothetical protein F511_06968 [Dorcoceras hygrometricum]
MHAFPYSVVHLDWQKRLKTQEHYAQPCCYYSEDQVLYYYCFYFWLVKHEHWQGHQSLAWSFDVLLRGYKRITVSTISWIKPTGPFYSLNTDGCRSNTGMIPTGGLIRNTNGLVLTAFDGFLGEVSVLKLN